MLQRVKLGARELSSLKPQLDENNVRLIGVGLEELGVEDFVAGKYWAGELYVDTKRETYQALGYTRYTWWMILKALFSRKARAALQRAKEENIEGDLKGEKLQTGGTLIVSAKGEKVLLNFKQSGPGDHVALQSVIDALGIEGKPPSSSPPTDDASPSCTSDACSANPPAEGASTDDKNPEPKMECTDDVCTVK